MPLYNNGATLIRTNLEQIQAGRRARLVAVGSLTPDQLAAINRKRTIRNLPPVEAEVVFIDKHVYETRIAKDGYAITDVIDQIASAMHADAEVLDNPKMTALQAIASREDRYGNCVKDRVVLECTTRYPRPELFSVIPKGDKIKPK
jgi:hypothetical protein